MFYEKYKDAFESNTQLPFQKQIQDIRTLQSGIAKKNNVFSKNASNIISSGGGNTLNINTSLRLEPDKKNYASVGNLRSKVGNSIPSTLSAYQNQGSSNRAGVGFVDRMPSARNGNLLSNDRNMGGGIKNHISSGLKDALSWNDEDSGSKFRAMKGPAPSSFFGGYGRHEQEKPKQHDFLSNLERSNVDIVNV